jgi:type III secretion protein R
MVGATAISAPVSAQVFGDSSSPLGMVAVLAVLALLPFFLIMVTSFVKIAVVLSLLRSAIGVQQVPPNQVITGLAIVLSVYIMAPVGLDIWTEVEPYVEQLEQDSFEHSFSNYVEVADHALTPLRGFLLKHSDPEERELLHELALEMRRPDQRDSLDPEGLMVSIPAFVLTELEEAFTIGFILFVPFLIVDLVVANVLLSLGMHMLSPTTVSLPFKLLLFVLVDGWYLVIRGLVLGYA